MRIYALFVIVCVLSQGYELRQSTDEELALRLLLEKTLGKLDRAYPDENTGQTDSSSKDGHVTSIGSQPATSGSTAPSQSDGFSEEGRSVGDKGAGTESGVDEGAESGAGKEGGLAKYGQWHQAYTSSNCDFLINILDGYIAHHIPIDATVTDYFDLDISEVRAQLPDLELTMQTVQDPEILAFTFTKKLTSVVLDRRVLCPATLFDIITIHVMIKEMHLMFDDEKGSLVDSLQTVLARFPTTWADPFLAASQMATQTHGRVFNDSIHFIMGTGLQDVALFSRRLFQTLKGLFQIAPHLMDNPGYKLVERFDAAVQDQLDQPGTPVHCPTSESTMQKFRDAAYDFIHGVENIETAEVCMEARDFIQHFSPFGSRMPALMDWSLYNDELMSICGYILEYIHAVMSAIREFDSLLMDQDTSGMKQLFQRHLSEPELEFLAKVLEHLKWEPLLPDDDDNVVGGNKDANGNLYIPANKVITHSKEDIKYLQSLLASLTKDSFSLMTFGDLRDIIKAWLARKQDNLDEYDKCSKMVGDH